ncbi:MAG: hypothetical protein M1274_06900 [Actinobacteria bacterium]|nr:hypothetical protein [Actinomycetota bacterium]
MGNKYSRVPVPTVGDSDGKAPNCQALDLLREVIENQLPEDMEVLALARDGCPADERRRQLVSLIASEFARSGLGPDDEPTDRGIELEELLDDINRPQTALPS